MTELTAWPEVRTLVLESIALGSELGVTCVLAPRPGAEVELGGPEVTRTVAGGLVWLTLLRWFEWFE